MRLAGIPIESKFYLVGNAVIARGLFRYTGAAGLGAPVRICVSQRDGEQTRQLSKPPRPAFQGRIRLRAQPQWMQLDAPDQVNALLLDFLPR